MHLGGVKVVKTDVFCGGFGGGMDTFEPSLYLTGALAECLG